MKKLPSPFNLHSNLRNSRVASKSCLHSNNLRNLRNLREIIYILVICGSLILCSCAHTRYIPLPSSHTRDSLSKSVNVLVNTTYVDRTHTLIQRGDTIFKTDSIYVEKFRDVEVHDTITVTLRDTITIPVQVEPPPDHSPRRRSLALSERVRVLGKGCLLGGIGAFLLLIFLRLYLHR